MQDYLRDHLLLLRRPSSKDLELLSTQSIMMISSIEIKWRSLV